MKERDKQESKKWLEVSEKTVNDVIAVLVIGVSVLPVGFAALELINVVLDIIFSHAK